MTKLDLKCRVSALNLIVFGPKIEHLDLIEYVVVDLLKVKTETLMEYEKSSFSIFKKLSLRELQAKKLILLKEHLQNSKCYLYCLIICRKLFVEGSEF